jgi:two-component system cell cycle response regulator CpdR
MARILVAEDDTAMRVFLDRALSRSGHVVDAVPSGDTAAQYAEKEAFDLLVTDIDMPCMNGVDLARKVLERTPKQAVLFITGFTAQALEATDLLARGAKVLPKPFELSELVEQVNGVLARGTASTQETS